MRNEQRAMLSMPGYGSLSAGAARGFWRASATPDAVHYRYNEGSLLAQNFNALWCTALNLVHVGERVDYFAMQHADVSPEDFWLDKLIAELEARELDVLGVPLPIKDPHGLTSVALARPDEDTWRPLCRLTMTEIYNLPETVTSEELGHPILINTGLWVCRFDPEWARQVHFTVNDRIVFNRKLGRYQAEVEPEDWFFSRLCHELGLKVGITRKVAATHLGAVEYANTHPWGDEFDKAYTGESVLKPQPAPEGFRFPHDVDGWLTRKEGLALAELARGKRVLEIGSYCGRSTVCLAQTAKHVTSVDPHDGRSTPRPRDTWSEFEDNLHAYGLRDKVSLLVGDFKSIAPTICERICDHEFDLIFIDGAHDYDSVSADVEHAQRLLAPGGLIAFHDYREHPGQHDGRWDGDVTAAVNEFLSAGAELVSTHDSLAVVRPPAEIPLEV